MLSCLLHYLAFRPYLDLEQMTWYLYNVFGILVSRSTVSRALKRLKWSRKVARKVARQRNNRLRTYFWWQLETLKYTDDMIVAIDESACDRRCGQRKYAWAPIGQTPAMVKDFGRGKRKQILPALTTEGILTYEVFEGNTDQ